MMAVTYVRNGLRHMSFKSIRRLNPLGFIILLALAIAVVAMVATQRNEGLAPRAALAEASGRVQSVRVNDEGIDFSLEGSDVAFRYPLNADDRMERVHRALRSAGTRTVTVLYLPAGGSDQQLHRPVNQLAVGHLMVRSYAQVKESWDRRRIAGRWVAGAMLVSALGLAWVGLFGLYPRQR
ncbi:hypothetical protein [Stenotrophomonas nematodicola]|uniref:DUF3592 domain-containing protein n=1 Tax=Stenotrophomonas nematodicola TaxID=2656746 RepID=A0ABW7D3X4_9GAMM